ncbi:MAG: hypothetical protein K2X86_06120 [Cytophagaceae bacterium]|nr:hypothetical protein [Cytophagaceae bacterium]
MNRSLSERRKMIEMGGNAYSISEQCRMLSIHRSGLYYSPVGESEENIYLHAYQDGVELYEGLKKYFQFYNHQHYHQSL